MLKKRIEWIDIAKAYGIIAVVFGHALASGTTTNMIYWWHMPLFFIIGGFFLKPINANKITAWKHFFNKKIYKDLEIYFIAGIILILTYSMLYNRDWDYLINHLSRLIVGGRTLNLYTSTFWFVNVYLLSIAAVTALISITKSRLIQIGVVLSGLFLATCYDKIDWLTLYNYQTMPWNADIVLIAAFFTYIGYLFFHTNWKWIEKPIPIAILLTLAGTLIFSYLNGNFNFEFSMKSHLIQTSSPKFLMISAIPLIFSFAVMGISTLTTRLPINWFLSIVGKHTMIIMYMHNALLDITRHAGINNVLTQVTIAIMVPVIIVTLEKPISEMLTKQRGPYLDNYAL
ncbi:acyltransferase family protein [Lentilactobacillus kisonensis]|uniref:Acyltransferase n=2 Tax=Lentilactobacillus kisonensis TaxID=481722 RepID=H1LJ84_9LACO|nr:acyltransferase family protein [Lentilactobacillus kisonensis]EHO48930.1 acyltransferase [Lentilactobacillus kisonensis F0435]KRL23049.1 acyltransferase [Lentilactobacillus kisonensis DSM 19906 = JCM 15041]